MIITCDYANPYVSLRDQLVRQMRDKIRQKLFDEAQRDHNNFTFQKALEIAKRYETNGN